MLSKINPRSGAQFPQNGGKADCFPGGYVQTVHLQTLPVPASAAGSWHIHLRNRKMICQLDDVKVAVALSFMFHSHHPDRIGNGSAMSWVPYVVPVPVLSTDRINKGKARSLPFAGASPDH